MDVKFESLVYDIEEKVRALRQLKMEGTEDVEPALMEICRAIRATKLHFFKVLERYGAKYERSGKDFVDLVYFAADLAASIQHPQLTASLARHAREVDEARSEAIAST